MIQHEQDADTLPPIAAAAQVPGPRPEPTSSAGFACPPAAGEQHRPGPILSAGSVTNLPARERAILDFEERRWAHPGLKEEAIRVTFDFSATRYYQILNALLDDPAALAYRPTLVARLRRIRETRRRERR